MTKRTGLICGALAALFALAGCLDSPTSSAQKENTPVVVTHQIRYVVACTNLGTAWIEYEEAGVHYALDKKVGSWSHIFTAKGAGVAYVQARGVMCSITSSGTMTFIPMTLDVRIYIDGALADHQTSDYSLFKHGQTVIASAPYD